jgi:hypothetical protein
MSDVSGSRFLRMAGSDNFQRRLNRSAMPTGTPGSSVGGDFTKQPVSGSNQVGGTTGKSGSFDYSMMIPTGGEKDKPSSVDGPGSFGAQIEREKYLEDNDIAQGYDTAEFTSDLKQINKDLNIGGPSDGSSIAMKYMNMGDAIEGGFAQRLDKNIRQRPLYHEAKSKLHGLTTYGDVDRWSKEALPDFKLPAPMEETEVPDLEGIGNRYMDRIGDVKPDI